ncbi:cytochrome c family protein [Geomonas sp. RF6]|uniref:cytochrome c7 n=1 Tax=Geomonas sp. RF6 TaxID=2897342 RepID=UPI001E547F04|nr:cytochrome c7 [Geomonas sp. RF6]UFS70208.1 cytochrome c family protein [Geomonas sp. RF6]
MTRFVTVLALTLFAAGLAAAAEDAVVVLPAKNGNVSFPHQKHKEALACTSCHETEKGGKIADLGKDWAHKTCMGCHKEKGKGPAKCNECHKK